MNYDSTELMCLFEDYPVRFLGTWENLECVGIDIVAILYPESNPEKRSGYLKGVPNEWKTPKKVRGIPLIVLKEAGLYYLLARSNSPKAFPFQKWLFEDVLPSIRKTGMYKLERENLMLKERMADYELAARHPLQLARWYKQYITLDPDAESLTKLMYDSYWRFCMRNNYHAVSSHEFREDLDRFVRKENLEAEQDKNNRNQWIFRGLVLND